MIGETTLTFEDMTKLTHQIEVSLNSRPLCTLSDNISNILVLTPGLFLIGKELLSPPHPVTKDINKNRGMRWRLIQKIKKDF